MTKEELKKRTKDFAVRVLKFMRQLAPGKDSEVIPFQLFKASSTVAPNDRAGPG